MPKEMRRRAAERALRSQGCQPKASSGRGSHDKWLCPCGSHTANIPRHTYISPGVVADTIERLGVSAERMAAVTKTYEVVAKRWRRGWELHIAGVGVTQSRSLAEAEETARDYIALDLDVPEDSFDIRVTPEVGDGVDEKVRQTRDEIRTAALAQSRAAESSRALVRELKALGLSGRDMAAVLGITPQRVSQLSQPRAGKAATKVRHRSASAVKRTPTSGTIRS